MSACNSDLPTPQEHRLGILRIGNGLIGFGALANDASMSTHASKTVPQWGINICAARLRWVPLGHRVLVDALDGGGRVDCESGAPRFDFLSDVLH